MKKLTLFSIILLIAAIPLGAAGANIVSVVAILALVFGSSTHRRRMSRNLYTPMALMFTYLAWMLFAAMMNAEHQLQGLIAYAMGYLPLALLPSLIAFRTEEDFSENDESQVFNALTAVVLLMGVCSLTQAIWGWERHGYHFVAGDTRARALFSHPLTLAYVAALIWPFALVRVFKHAGDWRSWAVFVSEIVIIWTSRSRVVQLLALVFLCFNIWKYASRRWRLVFFGAVIVGLGVVAVTENPVSRNFNKTFSGTSDRHTSAYADDRLAFWDAHWHLFRERPLMGHGAHLPDTARLRGYTAIGLPEFPKQYGAHNSYLQIAVEGGLVGLLLFLCWYGWFLRAALRKPAFLQALLIFALAIFTQNAFQDNEVRFSLTLVLAGLLVFRK